MGSDQWEGQCASRTPPTRAHIFTQAAEGRQKGQEPQETATSGQGSSSLPARCGRRANGQRLCLLAVHVGCLQTFSRLFVVNVV